MLKKKKSYRPQPNYAGEEIPDYEGNDPLQDLLDEEKIPQGNTIAVLQTVDSESKLLQSFVNVGQCCLCDLSKTCPHKNDTDTSCRAMNVATGEFISFALSNTQIRSSDMMGLRALSSLHGMIKLFEMYFNQMGITSFDKEGQLTTSSLTKEYVKMLSIFQGQLSLYGLNPRGREHLKALSRGGAVEKNPETDFHKYLASKNGEKEVSFSIEHGKKGEVEDEQLEPEREDQHNRVLQRSSAPGSPTPEDSGSDPEMDLSDDPFATRKVHLSPDDRWTDAEVEGQQRKNRRKK